MKILKTTAICVLLSLCMHSQAQVHQVQMHEPDYSKPKMFKNLPDRLQFKVQEFDGLFTTELGKAVNLPISKNFSFSGTVVSKSDDVDPKIKSIVIRSSENNGATLTISRVINVDNTISYKGRIMSFKHGDAYELTYENGTYYLSKKASHNLYNE